MTTASSSKNISESRDSLVGRGRELQQLDGLVDRIGTSGGTLVVRGAAGIGKSALLAAASERARGHGARVVVTAGTQSEAHLAFGGLHQLLQPFLGRHVQLPEPQRRALDVALGITNGPAPDLFLIGLATLGVLTEAAETTPLLLVVEDAHWLDRSSAQVLAFVARRLEMEVVILLFAVRDGVTGGVFEDSGLPELGLQPLDDDASRALLQIRNSVLQPELRERILTEAAGNPLALIELPRAVAGLDRVAPEEPLPLTAQLKAAFASRLNTLEPEIRTLLLLAALDDREVSELTRAAEHLFEGRRVFLHDWVAAAATGLGSLETGTFRYQHPLMRSAVYEAAGADQRRRAHLALAEALTKDPYRTVWHEAAAAEGTDEGVASALADMADQAKARGDLEAASSAMRRAATLTADPTLQAARLLGAADLTLEQGRGIDCIPLYREALRVGLPPHDAVRASFTLEAMSSAWSGASAIPRFAEIAEELVGRGDAHAALQALATVGMRAFLGPLQDSTRQRVSAIASGLAVPTNDPQRLATLALVDPVHRGGEVIQQLERISPLDVIDARDLTALGEAASAVWADSLAGPLLTAGVESHRADGRLVWLAQTLTLQAWVDARRGAVREAMTAAAEASKLGIETRQLRYTLVANLAHAIADADIGEADRSQQMIADVEAALMPMGAHPLLALATFARGRTALAADRPAEAYTDLIRIFNPTDVAFQPFVQGWALADLAEAALHGDGDLDLVDGFMRRWSEVATSAGAPSLRVQLAYVEAMLADDRIPPDRFEAALTRGADGSPFYLGRAQLAYGQWLRRQRRDIEAREPLREATQVFDALGQRCYADRARRELRATGERPRRRHPDAWTQLSPQELQIAQLAAEGLSNREIGQRLYLSHRTIGTHLYNLFPKLGITARAQLRDALNAPPDE
ncbi:MAG: AAA family ATPase [Nocardioides sp.]|nr:AAA family ATPase [Nocardioides sp.]